MRPAQGSPSLFLHFQKRFDGLAATVLVDTGMRLTGRFRAARPQGLSPVTAFIEHAVETAALRPYFEKWSSDPRLEPVWKRALAWG